MEQEKTPQKIEIVEPAPAEKQEPITMETLAEAGLQNEEIGMAKKHGFIESEDGGEGKPTQEGDKDHEEKGEEERQEKDKEGVLKKPEKSVDDRFRVIAEGKSPERIISEIAEKGDLTKDQEAVLLASLSNNGRNLYWQQKHERRQKQKVSMERDTLKTQYEEQQKKIDELNRTIEALKKTDSSDDDEDPLNLDNKKKTGDEKDPKKKPLTEEDLDRIEKERQDKEKELERKRMERAAVIKESLDDQRAEAEQKYKDFDDALQYTGQIIQAAQEGKLSELFPDPKVADRIEQEVQKLLVAFARADQYDVNRYNPADMTYDLGRQHPQYGKPTKKKADANGSKNGETDADGNPERMKRIIGNANRRGSSASLGSAGTRREISVEELTEEQAANLSESEWRKLPKEQRERLLGA